MSYVNPTEIESISNEIINIANNLNLKLSNISYAFENINSCIRTLKSWNGSDASQETLYKEAETGEKIRKCYKLVWSIKVRNYHYNPDYSYNNFFDYSVEKIAFNNLKEKINSLKLSGDDLNILSNTLMEHISTFSTLFSVEYTGCAVDFFNQLKDNDGWKATKELTEKIIEIKKSDELYTTFRSANGESDFVDFFLDEIGNGRYEQSLSGTFVKDDGNYSNKGATYYGEWYKTNFNEDFLNDYPFCAATVTYILASNNHLETDINPGLEPFQLVKTGAIDAQNLSKEGTGKWHAGSDTNYLPKRGDIFYNVNADGTGHTGVVLGCDDKYIYTIEGNTGSEHLNKSGGTVNTRVRPINYLNNGCAYSGYYSPNVEINEINPDYTQISESTKTNKLNYSDITR